MLGSRKGFFLWLLPIWQKYFTSTGQCWENHQSMMICTQKKICFGKHLVKTWNSHQMVTQSMFPLSLSLSLSLELRVLTIIMFHNLYPLSSTEYMNLGRALFLHDLISDVEIYICAHIFHILCKTVVRTDSRICIPFLSAASFHKFWNLKAFIHQLISLPIQSQVQSTFER